MTIFFCAYARAFHDYLLIDAALMLMRLRLRHMFSCFAIRLRYRLFTMLMPRGALRAARDAARTRTAMMRCAHAAATHAAMRGCCAELLITPFFFMPRFICRAMRGSLCAFI